MSPVYLHDLTLSIRGYTPRRYAWDLEGHYTLASEGNIHDIRERLRDFAIPHFQRAIRRYYGGMRLARGEIKAGWETEQTTLAPSRMIHVDLIEMVYHGRQHYPHSVASENLRFFRYDPEPEDQNEADEAYANDDEYEEDGEDDENEDDDQDEEDEDEEDYGE